MTPRSGYTPRYHHRTQVRNIAKVPRKQSSLMIKILMVHWKAQMACQ